MLIVWEDDDHAVVVLIAQHDRGAADVYGTLIDALDIDVPEAERTKPPCCGDDGLPPVDEELVDTGADAIRGLLARR